MGVRPSEIFYFFQCWDRLYTSESVVYRLQILMYKDGPSDERVNKISCADLPTITPNKALPF